jgi:hypothetical protein
MSIVYLYKRMRCVIQISRQLIRVVLYSRGTELKNLLLYGLLPHLLTFLDEERLAHIALFVCFIRVR